MNCGSCGTRGTPGKFCTECGRRLSAPAPAPAPGAAPSSSTSSRTTRVPSSGSLPLNRGVPSGRVPSSNIPRRTSGVVSNRTSTSTYSGLTKAPTTQRGANIKQAMDDLADDVYGTDTPTPMRPDMLREAQTCRSSGRFYRPVTSYTSLGQGWTSGPADEEGSMFDSSDRNILCMAVKGNEVVVGGADHGLRVYDLSRKRELRNLFTKRYGHSDWVTSCAYLDDGRIISAGQDSKLCLWAKAGVRCTDLTGHTGSISQVQVGGSIAISASYDRTLRLWDCDRSSAVGVLSGHAQPVMEFIWKHSTLVSGDRCGAVRAWDAERETCVGVLTSGGDKRRGQCSAMGWYGNDSGDSLVMAGDQTGRLRVWDLRSGPDSVQERMLHAGGAVTGIQSTESHIVTCGADKHIKVLDSSLQETQTISTHKDFIYSLEVVGDKIVSGDGMGWLLVHDLNSGECKYGLGANKAAVRCIHADPHRLVASGDDGSLVSYDM